MFYFTSDYNNIVSANFDSFGDMVDFIAIMEPNNERFYLYCNGSFLMSVYKIRDNQLDFLINNMVYHS